MKIGLQSRKAKSWSTLTILLLMFLFQGHVYSQVTVSGAVSGNGTYPNLNSAFTAINASSQSAASITVDITASTTETVTAQLNAGTWTSLLVRPSGTAAVVSGSLAAPLVDLNGASNVTIDGLNSGGNALVLINTSTGTVLTTTLRFMNGASSNTIMNCTLLGASNNATLGTVCFSTTTGTGNNLNVVTSCTLGASGTDFPVNAIYSGGTTANPNNLNRITQNMIADYYSPNLVSTGISVASASNSWTISANRLYQTAARTYTVANTHRGINIGAGDGYVVTNNVIGYSSAAGTGTTVMTSTVALIYVGIQVAAGTATASSVQGNTITAITLTTSSSASTANGILCGINVTAGNVNVGNVASNVIGGTSGTDLITGYPTTTGGLLVGIHASSTGTLLIQNNYVGGLSVSTTSAAVTGGIMGINISGIATQLSILSNTIGNTSANNLRAGTLITTANSLFAGINIASIPTGTVVVNSNIIRNAASYGTGTTGTLRGIYTAGLSGTTTFSVMNNVISDLTTNNANTAVGNGQIGNVGIAITCGSNNRISNNIIYNISNTTTATTAVVVCGISTAVSSNPIIDRNTIYGLSNTGTSTSATAPAMVFGIFVRGATNDVNIFNNMISLGTGQTANTAFLGICAFSGGGTPTMTRVYYNTINIAGNNTTGNQPSIGIYRGNFSTSAVTFPMDIRNNLVTNSRTGGTGGHYAISNNYGATAASTSGWGANASNYNVLNAASTTVGHWSGALGFNAWKSASAGDGNSYSGIPVTYVNAVSDLHLNMGATPTLIESLAQAITSVTTDFDNQTRPGPAGSTNGGALAPDIGADEFDGTPLTCTNTTMSGGTIAQATGSACSGQTLAVNSASATVAMGVTYQWQVATSAGGPYSNVSGGTGAASTSYTSAPLSTGVYYVVLRATCTINATSVLSNEATLTVNSPPGAVASVSSPSACSGTSIALNAASSTGTSFLWSGPMNYTSAVQNPTLTNLSYLAGGVYSVTVGAAGCFSTSSVSFSVNATPSAVTVTPSSSLICSGGTVTSTGSGGVMPAIFNFTPQTNQNAATAYPAPYTVYYGGQKMQMYVLASELTAQGITAGSLTAIQFPVVSKGSNWGTSITSLQSFQVSIGHTSNSAASNNFETGLTVVSSAANFTPNVGYNNMHIFNTPFVWDGTSNIVIETVFSNNITGTTNDAVIQYNSSTSFASTIVYRADGQTFSTIASQTSSNTTLSNVRPDFKLHGQALAPFIWSPSSGLSSTTSRTVQAYPTSSTIYTAQASNSGCSSSATLNVSVSQPPALQAVANASSICSGGSSSLTASGAPTYTWNTNQQTAVITVTPSSTTVYTVSSIVAPCPVVTATTQVSVSQPPVLQAMPVSPMICDGDTVSLIASGANTYTWMTTPPQQGSVITVSPNSTTIYTVSSIEAPCPIVTTTAEVVVNPLPDLIITPSNPSVCVQSAITLTVSGGFAYIWSNNDMTPTTSLTVNSNTTMYVLGVDSMGCFNMDSVMISANPLPVIVIAPSANSVCANSAASFTASGATNYTWSTGATTAVLAVTPSVSGVYTATGSLPTGCSSTQTASIFAFSLPTVAITSNRDTICAGESQQLTVTGATSFQWEPGGVSGSANTVSPAATTEYTVTGTDGNNCQDVDKFVLVVDACTGVREQSFASQLAVFPNPTSGLITASVPFTGEKIISVMNSAGQLVKTIRGEENNIAVDLREHARGIYFVRIEVQGQMANFRIVID